MSKTLTVAILAMAGLGLAGCASGTGEPMIQVQDVQITTPTDISNLTYAIDIALRTRRWDILSREPGRIVAKYPPAASERTETATIAVVYDSNSYSIEYVDSENLLYDANAGTIHKAYNRWVNNLDHDLAIAFRMDDPDVRRAQASSQP